MILEKLEGFIEKSVLPKLLHGAVNYPVSTFSKSEVLEFIHDSSQNCLAFAVEQSAIDNLETLTLPPLALSSLESHECLCLELMFPEG